MKVKCTNKSCLHEWNYQGRLKDNDYITCSICRYKSLIKKAKLTDLHPKIDNKLSEKSTDLLTDLPTNKESNERVYFKDGFDCLISKNMVQQFKDIPLEDDEEKIIEESSEIKVFTNLTDFNLEVLRKSFDTNNNETSIKILNYPIPRNIQEALNRKEQEQDNIFLNPPEEEPNFELKIIP